MTDGTENKDVTPKPASPGFKRFPHAKLVPPPSPIPQGNDHEKFPIFLGVGIALSMLALVTVFVLSFTTAKKKTQPTAASPAATPAASARP